MSIALMTQAWALEIGATDKIVLLALADHANDQGICWPGNSSISKKCGMSERAVRNAMRALQEAGHLTCYFVTGKPTNYHVHPGTSCPRQNVPPAPRSKTPARGAPKSSVTIIKGKEDARERAPHHLPDDFEPDALSGVSAATVARWQPGELESQLQRFRDHWASSGTATAKKRNWQAAWRTWIGNHDERRNPTPIGHRPMGGSGQPHRPGLQSPHSDRLAAGLRIREKYAAAEAAQSGNR